jgi:hypothetical protein
MNKQIFTLFIDEFASAPLLCLLPEEGSVNKLASFLSSMHIKFERASQVERELSLNKSANYAGSGSKSLLPERLACELDMLREVLNWLDFSLGEIDE